MQLGCPSNHTTRSNEFNLNLKDLTVSIRVCSSSCVLQCKWTAHPITPHTPPAATANGAGHPTKSTREKPMIPAWQPGQVCSIEPDCTMRASWVTRQTYADGCLWKRTAVVRFEGQRKDGGDDQAHSCSVDARQQPTQVHSQWSLQLRAQQRRLGFRILGFLDRRRWQQEGGWGRSNHVPAIDLEVSEHAPPAAEIPVTGSSVC